MAAPTTIHDLPDDMLHEIFGRVFAAEPGKPSLPALYTDQPPEGAHAALRCVYRRWRDIADWVRLSTSQIVVDTALLADAGAVRARHPAAFKSLVLAHMEDSHSTSLSRAAASLINGSADLRRALSQLQLQLCCLPSLLPAVATVASCTALTNLCLCWGAHKKKERVPPSNMLAPLSALRKLGVLEYVHPPGVKLPTRAMLAPLPALPDAPQLTYFRLKVLGNFVPVGSDAALGRLHLLVLKHGAPVRELVDAEDPFLLRAALEAGTWQPSRLTLLKEVDVHFEPVRGDSRPPVRPPRTGTRAGSEWAPLAGQVTALQLFIESDGFKRPSTGIVAGLGALTALRELRVTASFSVQPDPASVHPVSLDRVRAPHLKVLALSCTTTPVNVARFPNLVRLTLASITRQPPLNLRSLVARSSLKFLILFNRVMGSPDLMNLAELFVGGSGWPVLEELRLLDIALEWDTTGLAGAPTAAEFAERARQLLPALVRVEVKEPAGNAALRNPLRFSLVYACYQHVVPALRGLHAGGA